MIDNVFLSKQKVARKGSFIEDKSIKKEIRKMKTGTEIVNFFGNYGNSTQIKFVIC
jgi:hypothetical protein